MARNVEVRGPDDRPRRHAGAHGTGQVMERESAEGRDRVDVAYVWPHTLRLPERPPKLVYLDLNHLIELAKALAGHRDGEAHVDVLTACLRAVEDGRAVFPISDSIYAEIYANSPRHLLWRLETMALMSDVGLPVAHVRNQVASAIDVVVHTARLRDGRRVVFQIATVEGLQDGEPLVSEIFAFRPRDGSRGGFVATGQVPPLARVLAERGEAGVEGLFDPGSDDGRTRRRVGGVPPQPPSPAPDDRSLVGVG